MEIIILVCFAIASATQGVIGLFESCVHGGMKYMEGQNFTPNDTLIKTESPHQCVQCRCLRGLVLCEIENCPYADCEAPLRTLEFCCPQCPAVERGKGVSDLIFGKTGSDMFLEKNGEGDCLSNGVSFKNGSVWQPVIGPFGVMACVQCRCHAGSIICARMECGKPGCSKPRREFGQCCPVCSTSELNEGKAFCLPKSSELFVFKTANVRNNSDRIEYAFLENNWDQKDVVKIHTWNLKGKSSEDLLDVSIISRKDFRKRSFQILGSTSRKRFQKYTRRERKLKKNCSIKCFLKIERLEHTLLDISVNTRVKCAADEVDVDDL